MLKIIQKTKSRPARAVIYGQISLLIAIALSVAIKPAGLSENDGFSYYGVDRYTAAFYVLGLVIIGGFYLLAARGLAMTGVARLARFMLYLIVLALAVTVVTPYTFSLGFHTVHIFATFALFALETSLAVWLVAMSRFDWQNLGLLVLLLGAATLMWFSLRPRPGFLLQSEIVFQLMFSFILARSISGTRLEEAG